MPTTVDSAQQPRWWQWPTVLSLDAPIVAMLWQALIGRAANAHLGWPPVVVLGLSVWLSYAADRWIEGWRLERGSIRTPRHFFYHRHRWPVAAVWILALCVDVAIALRYLPTADVLAGTILVVAVAAYLLSHQFVHRHSPWRVPKEICIAGLLASGVGVFLIRAPQAAEAVAPLTAFGALCLANTALISVWEQHVDRAHGQTSLVAQTPARAAMLRRLPWLIAGLGAVALVAASNTARTVAACVVCSALLLAAVDAAERRIGRQPARVLADFALFTPLVPLLWR